MFFRRIFICRNKQFFKQITYKCKMSTFPEDDIIKAAKKLIPVLSLDKHKGQDGRIGIVGGSFEYSGAPFFAGMSALRTGADLVHIFCSKEASTPIKSFSPELIVHPILDNNDALNQIEPWLERLHVILIGPGLGREDHVFRTVSNLIITCRALFKPLVIDADGLFLVSQKPDLIKNYPGLVLTPNAMEFTRLVKAFLHKDVPAQSIIEDSIIKQLAEAIGEKVTIVHKGGKDSIADGLKNSPVITCSSRNSGRRCGGQGDLLAGALSVFTSWSRTHEIVNPVNPPAHLTACYAACRLIRECNLSMYQLKGRSMLASDMLGAIGPKFAELYEK